MAQLYKENKISFISLNVTQFLGAMNDNIFKLLIVYLLISIQGPNKASIILSLTGFIFVIPFLLFSSASGVLADKISKRNILVTMKFAELILMALSLVAIYYESEIGILVILFFMATQSAIFGPSKYGIIPEIVPTEKVSKANGILSAFSNLAIICGTFLASFITDITNKHFVVAANLCVIVAVFGFLASLKIKKTPANKSTKKINPLFVYEIYETLKLSYKRKHLLPSIFGSAFFLFIGGYAQLNIIPYAIQSLNLTAIGGGYLFLSTAIGIVLGALIAGKVSKDRLELGMSCVSGFVISILLVILGTFNQNLIFSIIMLILLGIFGGMFLIPFDSFIQVKSPEQRRGQIIATANFLSFVGVLLATLCLYIFSELLNFSAASGFIIMGAITFVFNFINSGRLSDIFFPYISRKFLKHFYRIEINEIPPKNSIIILNEFSWAQMLTLFLKMDNLKIITTGKILKNFPLLNCFSNTIHMIPEEKFNLYVLKKAAEDIDEKDSSLCLLLKKPFNLLKLKSMFSPNENIYLMKTEKTSIQKRFFGKNFSRTIFMVNLEKI